MIGVAAMNHFPDLEPSWPLLESDLAIDSDWAVLYVEYDYGGSAAIILHRTAKGNFKIKCTLSDPSEVNIAKALAKLGANSSEKNSLGRIRTVHLLQVPHAYQ